MKAHSTHLLALVLSVLLILSCVPFTASAADETLPATDLQNLYYALKHNNEIRIVYLGGSVTQGAGASSSNDTSWRGLVGKWFTDNFGPGTAYDKTITNIHAAVGATGTFFGAYRFYQDARCDQGIPDVLFVEFSINDMYDKIGAEKAALYYESIIRQAYEINPKIQILPVFTMDINIADNYMKTGSDSNDYFTAHRAVAAHYSLPQLNVGHALIDVIEQAYADAGATFSTGDSSNASSVWRKYITDTCHPNDKGYKVYADTIIDYLTAQLLGDGVTRDENAYDDVVLPASTYAATAGYNEAKLITHGRSISFKDAGFTPDKLNGFALKTTDAESIREKSNGTIYANANNASFAFTFKGTGVGFYNHGYPQSGTLLWTVTAVDDSSVKYEGSNSLVKSYATGLPWPADLITGLEDRTWKVECVVNAGTNNGTIADLRYIYVDGDPSTVTPVDAPPMPLPPITVSASDCTTAYGGTLSSNPADFKGFSSRVLTVDTASDYSPQIDNRNFTDYNITFPTYKKVAVTYYYDNGGNPSDLNMVFELEQLQGSGYIPGTVNDPGYAHTRRSASLTSGKWVTQYFDYTSFADMAAEKFPGQVLYQVGIFPFGNVKGNSGTLTGKEAFYLNEVTFYQDLPFLYNAEGNPATINDGSAIAYASSTGKVTVNGKELHAYTTIKEAIEALGPVGGIVKFTGTQTFADDETYRQKITLVGLDSTAKLSNKNLIVKGGGLELQNLTMTGGAATPQVSEDWTYSYGHTITFGEGFKIPDANEMPYGMTQTGGANCFNFNSDSVRMGLNGAAAGAGLGNTVKGDTVYNYYRGNFIRTITAISRNSYNANPITDAKTQKVEGNIYLNFYGGENILNIFVSTRQAKLTGNLIVTVNGGKFTSGKHLNFSSQNEIYFKNQRPVVTGNIVYIFNNDEIKNAGGTLSGVIIGQKLGKGGGKYTRSAYVGKVKTDVDYNTNEGDGKKLIISNHHELASSTGVSIDGGDASLVLMVNGGKAEPVINGTDPITGYKFTSDTEGTLPYIGDTCLVTDATGVVTLPEGSNSGKVTVTFKEAASPIITYSDGDGNTTVGTGESGSSITLPANPFTKNDYYFLGWKTAGDDTLYLPGDAYALGETSVTFTAQWIAKNAVETVYVKQTAESSGTGLDPRSPVKTLKEAINIAGADRDFTVVFTDMYNDSINGEWSSTGISHTGTITYSSTSEGGLQYKSSLYPKGPAIYKNLNLNIVDNNNFIQAVGGYLMMGENVQSNKMPKIHLGKENADSPFQYLEINGGTIANTYVGSFYNQDLVNARKTAGAKVVVNGGSVTTLFLGADSYNATNRGPVAFTDTVTVLYNGGTIGAISKGAPAVTYQALQFIANNGKTFPTLPAETDNSNRYIVLSGVGGTVTDTETAGTFKILSDTGHIYIDGVEQTVSEDNRYTLEPGDHTVAYSADNYVSVGGKNLPVFNDTVKVPAEGIVDFTVHSAPQKEGYLFLGWYKEDAAVRDGDTLAAGDVLSAKYLEFITDSSENENADFVIAGAQIRLSGETGLRFVNNFDKGILNALNGLDSNFKQPASTADTGVGYGFAVLPENLIPVGETLTKETADAGIVPAVKTYSENSERTRYTVCITGITETNYDRVYMTVPYITYIDANGCEQTVYGKAYGTSLYTMAKTVLGDTSATLSDEHKALLQSIVKTVDNAEKQ